MTDEDGFKDYADKVIINGEEVEAYYEADENYLSLEYRFLPEEQDSQEAEEETSDKGITATEMDKYLCGLNSDTGFKGSSYLPLMLKSAKQTRKTISLKVGEKARIKGTPVKASRKTKVKSILKMRYVSSRPEVATVTAKGVIKARGKGSCIIYVYTQNGVCKGLKIKVK